MIKVERTCTYGLEGAIRGMRNPLNSWKRTDSYHDEFGSFVVGENDLGLMQSLFKACSEHAKYLRMIHVQMDVTAPLYWWKEFDQYKIATTTNSCSTMHKIHAKEFEIDDFSHDKLHDGNIEWLEATIDRLNRYRKLYNLSKSKEYWWQLIQLLPSSYNQKRTIDMDYQTVLNIINLMNGLL